MAGKRGAELRCRGNQQRRDLPPPPTSLASTGRRGGAGKRSGCKAKATLNKRLGCGQSNFFRRDAQHSHKSFSAGAGMQSEGAGGRPFLPAQTQPKGRTASEGRLLLFCLLQGFLANRAGETATQLLRSLGYCVRKARCGERHLPCSGEPAHRHGSRAGAEPCRSSVSSTSRAMISTAALLTDTVGKRAASPCATRYSVLKEEEYPGLSLGNYLVVDPVI